MERPTIHSLGVLVPGAVLVMLGIAFDAAAQPAPDQLADWSRLVRVKAGARLRVTTSTDTRDLRLLLADRDGLVLLSTADVEDENARSALEGVARNQPEQLARLPQTGGEMRLSGFRLSADGLFVNGRKTVEIDRVIVSVEKSTVREIVSRDRPLNTGTGFLLGVLGGFGVGLALSDGVCHGCGGVALIGGLIGAAWGHHVARPERYVLYRQTDP